MLLAAFAGPFGTKSAMGTAAVPNPATENALVAGKAPTRPGTEAGSWPVRTRWCPSRGGQRAGGSALRRHDGDRGRSRQLGGDPRPRERVAEALGADRHDGGARVEQVARVAAGLHAAHADDRQPDG